MSFGTITHQIGDDLAHEVFINLNPGTNQFEVVVYSNKPSTLSLHHASDRLIYRKTDKNASVGDDTYANAAEVVVSGSGSVTFKIDDHIIPTISWVQDGDVITLTDFAGDVAYLENGIWFVPENERNKGVNDILVQLKDCTDVVERERLKDKIIEILGADPDYGRFILNTLLGDSDTGTH